MKVMVMNKETDEESFTTMLLAMTLMPQSVTAKILNQFFNSFSPMELLLFTKAIGICSFSNEYKKKVETGSARPARFAPCR